MGINQSINQSIKHKWAVFIEFGVQEIRTKIFRTNFILSSLPPPQSQLTKIYILLLLLYLTLVKFDLDLLTVKVK